MPRKKAKKKTAKAAANLQDTGQKVRKETIAGILTRGLIRSDLKSLPREIVNAVVNVMTDEIANVIRKVEMEKAIDYVAENYKLSVKADINLTPVDKNKKRRAAGKRT